MGKGVKVGVDLNKRTIDLSKFDEQWVVYLSQCVAGSLINNYSHD